MKKNVLKFEVKLMAYEKQKPESFLEIDTIHCEIDLNKFYSLSMSSDLFLVGIFDGADEQEIWDTKQQIIAFINIFAEEKRDSRISKSDPRKWINTYLKGSIQKMSYNFAVELVS
jgi:hypothetical protein